VPEEKEPSVSTNKKRVGIVLFQLGGPDSLATVEPFLRNLFLDPDIIPLGPLNFIRGPLARYIARKRTPPVAARYGQIGRRSPIAILTERQRVRLVAIGSHSPKTPSPRSNLLAASTNSSSSRSTRTTPTPPHSAA
jgi:protoporphyrin/coproporphyrin ferrochelatase